MVVSTECVGTHGQETVVGDTPNLAARLQSLAEPGCVLVGATTHQLTRYFFDFAFVGATKPKLTSYPDHSVGADQHRRRAVAVTSAKE